MDSSLYRMADRMAGGRLEAILGGLRASGESFDTIAKRLYAEHGIDVSSQTVANWWAVLEHNACERCTDVPTWHNGDPCPNEPAVAS